MSGRTTGAEEGGYFGDEGVFMLCFYDKKTLNQVQGLLL
jgi:hypothetical protein